MELEKDLYSFRDITLKLMDRVQIQGNRLFLLKQREEILNKIRSSDYELSEIKRIAEILKLEELEKELKDSVINEMNNIKEEMKQLRRKQQGNQAYINFGYGGNITSSFDKRY